MAVTTEDGQTTVTTELEFAVEISGTVSRDQIETALHSVRSAFPEAIDVNCYNSRNGQLVGYIIIGGEHDGNIDIKADPSDPMFHMALMVKQDVNP